MSFFSSLREGIVIIVLWDMIGARSEDVSVCLNFMKIYINFLILPLDFCVRRMTSN